MSFEGWNKVKLGEIANVQTGPFGSQLHVSDYTEVGIPVIMPVNISNEKVDTDKIARVHQNTADSLAKHKVLKGDIVFSRRGDVERHAYIRDENVSWLCGTGCLKVRVKESVSSRFISYQLMLADKKTWLRNHAVGTTMPNLNTSILSDLEINLPEIKIQRRIAAILSSLDDKIELNRQMNQTLEAIAQALFNEWFVAFNFPGATGEMQDSALGKIPKGWTLESLDRVAEFLNGIALQKFPAENDKDFLPVIKIRELKNGVTNSSDKASTKIQAKYIVDDGDLLFSWSGTLEVKFWVGGKGALNQHLFKVTSSKYPMWFCYLWICHHLAEFRKIAEDKTTTMGHIQRRHLTEALCLIPEHGVLKKFDAIIKPMYEQILSNEQQIQTLIQLRDSLLPKLMKGEISVTETFSKAHV